jgi:hypothetical protein
LEEYCSLVPVHDFVCWSGLIVVHAGFFLS